MNIQPARVRGLVATAVAVMVAVLTALAPAASATPLEGTGGSTTGTSALEPNVVVRTVTETVTVGVPYLAAVAIGLLTFAAAWLLATYVTSHRIHRSAMG